jgi:hypothetical protein
MGWGYGVDLDPVEDAIRELKTEQSVTHELLSELLTEVREIRWVLQGAVEEEPKRRRRRRKR